MTEFSTIPKDEAERLIQEQDVEIIDIRDQLAFNDGHIENARHIPFDQIGDFIEETDKSVPVLIYCYRGNSSRAAAQYLTTCGFEHVYNLEGGYAAWGE